VHVVYGLVGLKTHCKVALVVRREGEALRRYVHVATGNYNPVTSNFYTDLGLLTADDDIGADATDLFNFLTGFSRQKEYRKLLVSPVALRERTVALIRREAEHARAGRPARIVVKINRLADTRVISALYEASQAGVPIDLIVRGICMLKPGVPGLSETISVRSIVGRFLEHARIFYFENGGDPLLYCGSADWMPRNFFRRVETLFPVEDPELRKRIVSDILGNELRDTEDARELQPSGKYVVPSRPAGDASFSAQKYFMAEAAIRGAAAAANAATVIAPAPAVVAAMRGMSINVCHLCIRRMDAALNPKQDMQTVLGPVSSLAQLCSQGIRLVGLAGGSGLAIREVGHVRYLPDAISAPVGT
jgi:polyphosphate kinase